jgi:heme oxygenase (biliverdin-IX-beta and delta-forming)
MRGAEGGMDILQRLRRETRLEHDAIEQVLGLTEAALTLQSYRKRIGQFYGFYVALEEALRPYAQTADEGDWLDPRLTKTTDLSVDLAHLGLSVSELPICRNLPPLTSRAERLGCLYVIEGATLGGRVIALHIEKQLQLTASSGGRFFRGYGSATGAMWQALRQVLLDNADGIETENNIIASASATFVSLRRWCEETTQS